MSKYEPIATKTRLRTYIDRLDRFYLCNNDSTKYNKYMRLWCDLLPDDSYLESIYENNWIRRMDGLKRLERRRMKDLREMIRTAAWIAGKLVKRAGDMVWMKEESLPKRSEPNKHGGCGKWWRQQPRWTDRLKEDLRQEENENWIEKANKKDYKTRSNWEK